MNATKTYEVEQLKMARGVPRPRSSRRNAIVIAGLSVGFGLLVAYLSYASGMLALAMLVAVPAAVVTTVLALPAARQRLVELLPKLSWWHGLWFLLYLSGLVFRPGRSLSAVRAEPIDAWAMLRIGPELIVCVVLLVRLALRKPAWLKSFFRGMVGALAFYAGVCLLSSVWSVYPAWTFYKSWEYLVDVGTLATILVTVQSTEDYGTLINWTWAILSMELLWTLAQGAIFRNDAWDDMGRLTSVIPMGSSNAMSGIAGMVAITALCRLLPIEPLKRSARAFYVAAFMLGFICLILAKTRNALAGFVFAVCLILFFSRRFRTVAILAVVAAGLLAMSSVQGDLYDYLSRGQTENTLTNLNGRMNWWTFAWEQFSHHPVTGLGAYAGGKFAVLTKIGMEDASSLHSDYIETIVGSGLGGLLPLLASLIGTWWFLVKFVRNRLLTAAERQFAYECVGVLGVITIHSFFNVEMTWQAPIPYLLVVGFAEFLRRKYQNAPAKNRSFPVEDSR